MHNIAKNPLVWFTQLKWFQKAQLYCGGERERERELGRERERERRERERERREKTNGSAREVE